MLIIVEIALTIWAWWRGWKAWALLPLGIALLIGFLIGFIMGAAVLEEGWLLLLVIDVAAIGALIFMIVKPRRKANPL